LIAKVMLSAF